MNQIPSESSIFVWWPTFSKALFILARTFDPQDTVVGVHKLDPLEAQQKMFDFILNVCYLLPDRLASKLAIDFIFMKKYVVDNLVHRLPKFFYAFPQYYDQVLFNGENFLNVCLQSSSSLFNWVYLLQCFMFLNLQDSNYKIKIPSLTEVRVEYNIDKISINDWGNSLWYILHMCSLYAPEPMNQSFENYRMILQSLQYLLPCPKCRLHLQQNLSTIDIDNCAQTRIELFKCSWKLHNKVNVDTGKSFLPFEYSIQLYLSNHNNLN